MYIAFCEALCLDRPSKSIRVKECAQIISLVWKFCSENNIVFMCFQNLEVLWAIMRAKNKFFRQKTNSAGHFLLFFKVQIYLILFLFNDDYDNRAFRLIKIWYQNESAFGWIIAVADRYGREYCMNVFLLLWNVKNYCEFCRKKVILTLQS